eukprot:scaffold1572_cov141-Skeletonema_menzelii.AAC.10
MPLKEKPWDFATNKGNPTRAKVVNNFIRRICDLEKEGGGSKKRKSGETPSASMPPNSGLPSTGKKARVAEQPTASSSSNEIIASILQKMQLQNSLTIDFIGSLGNSLNSYRNTLQANNQTITAELQMLNNRMQQSSSNDSVPPTPVARIPTAAASPVLSPLAAASVPVATVPQPSSAPIQQRSWFYSHPDGSTRRVPPSWKFPSGTLLELYTLWHLGDPENCISPMKTFSTSDVYFCGKRSRMSLSEARCLANALDAEAIKAGKSIPPNMSQAELVEIFRVAVNGLEMPLETPTGRQRDIFRLKWSTFTKYKVTPKEGTKSESAEGKQLTYDQAQVDPDGGHWLYEHADGKRRKVPSSWTFPMVGLQDIYVLWNCSNDQQQIVPMKNFTSKDVNFLKKGSKNLAEVRGLMKIISDEAASKGFEIKDVMTVSEALSAFSAGVGALNIPPMTPQGKARDVARTKWSSASRFKNVPSEPAKSTETTKEEEVDC